MSDQLKKGSDDIGKEGRGVDLLAKPILVFS
jgi:hypothetical protein